MKLSSDQINTLLSAIEALIEVHPFVPQINDTIDDLAEIAAIAIQNNRESIDA